MDNSYIAGLFDGEGHIGLYQDNRWRTYSLYVTIGVTDSQGIFGIYQLYPEAKYNLLRVNKIGLKPLFRLSFFGHKAQRFLEDIHPYTLVKTRQIEDALEYLSLAKTAPKRNRPEEFHIKCMELVGSIKEEKYMTGEEE